jgi:hypothetical protein
LVLQWEQAAALCSVRPSLILPLLLLLPPLLLLTPLVLLPSLKMQWEQVCS